jgi:hypothetical protein
MKKNTKRATMAESVFGVSIAIFGMVSQYLRCFYEYHPIGRVHIDIDTLTQFKTTPVVGGKWKKHCSFFPTFSHLPHFVYPFATNIPPFRVIIDSMIDKMNSLLKMLLRHLRNHSIARKIDSCQWWKFIPVPGLPKKNASSTLHNGFCHKILVNKGILNDNMMTQCITIVDINPDSDENYNIEILFLNENIQDWCIN